jgi:4-diphosphocytidyl-2-C-methyl-D-erythritol kinase
MGGTALSEGIGEILTPLPKPPRAYLLVAKPDISVSTRFVYENLHADTLTFHPDIDGMVTAIKEGSLGGIAERMGNVLETVTEKAYPVIGELKTLMREQGAMASLMSGSGPTVFGVFETEEAAKKAYIAVQKQGSAKQLFVTEFV